MTLSIVDWFGYNLSPQERMRLIKKAGFSGIIGFIWADLFDSNYKSFPEYAGNAGLYVENIHGPWSGANELWNDSLNGQNFMEEIFENIKACSFYEIPTLVMHPECKNGTEYTELPENFDIGIDRWERITDFAERLDVNIAVENMARPEYLDCIFTNIKSKRLGFCFDSGHWNLFMPELDLLTLYGDRLMALHLHDNDGINDWHALPLSGNIDWDDIKTKLKSAGYKGSIALEVGNKNFEHIKEPEKFLQLAVESAKKLI
ncbi:MAG: sugar phosphate isomerase/epimerase [Oscillospiraceae bacterium]|nr:sugar phosphate isomerase/epimerase [Oscillospiraceae bacterium]